MPTLPVTLEDVEYAAARIGDAVVHTPCLRSETLSRIAKADVWVKFENLQFTASFKERGALNTLLQLTDEEKRRGVIAMSAGNHAQGVAYHAGRLGIPATIVMPSFTPNTKVEHTRGHGARVVLHGDTLAEAGHRGASPGRRRQAGVRASLRRSAHHRRPGHDRARDAGGRARARHAGGAGGRRRHDRGLRRGGARAETRHQGDRRRDDELLGDAPAARRRAGDGGRRHHRRGHRRARHRQDAACHRPRAARPGADRRRGGDRARHRALPRGREDGGGGRGRRRRSPPCWPIRSISSAARSAWCCRAATSTPACWPRC